LWILGYPDQGRRRSNEALALAEQLSHPPSLAYARFFAAAFYRYCGLLHPTWELLAATQDLADEHDLALWKAAIAPMRGWVMSQEGLLEEGLSEMQRGQAAVRSLGGELAYLRALPSLAESYMRAGRFEQAKATLDEALELIHVSGLVTDLPEVWRWKGELALMAGAADEAEACTREASATAVRYGTRSWQLRAALSLARILDRQGRWPEGQRMLGEVLGAFTEGFDTPDLQEAMTLLRRSCQSRTFRVSMPES
jgi:predicted ATPase